MLYFTAPLVPQAILSSTMNCRQEKSGSALTPTLNFHSNFVVIVHLYLLVVLLDLVEHVHEELLRILLPRASKLRMVLAHNLFKY